MDIILKYFPDLTETQKNNLPRCTTCTLTGTANQCHITQGYHKLVRTSCASLAGHCQVYPVQAGNTYHGPGHGRWFSGHTACYFIPRLNVSSGRQHRKESQGCNRNCQCHRTENVTTRHCRAEEEKQMFDFVVSRAVMPLTDLLKIIRKNISKEQHNAFPNGLVCLKGGELEKEVFPVKHQTMVTELKDFFSEEFLKRRR